MLGSFRLHHSSVGSRRSCFAGMFSLGWPGSPCVSWQHAWQRYYTLLVGSSPLSCPASDSRFPSCSSIAMLPSLLTFIEALECVQRRAAKL